jgi:hypothetical protein
MESVVVGPGESGKKLQNPFAAKAFQNTALRKATWEKTRICPFPENPEAGENNGLVGLC